MANNVSVYLYSDIVANRVANDPHILTQLKEHIEKFWTGWTDCGTSDPNCLPQHSNLPEV